MGKFVGFIGTIRGKVGTTVFTKGENGVSYGRAYQPQVRNPKSVGQTDQRAKMNLVGRMSQATPKDLLVGMNGASNRQRRSAFTSNLLNQAIIDRSAPGSVIAKVNPEDVIFSQGSTPVAATVATPTVTATSVTVPITLSDEALAGKYGERIIVAIIDPSDKAGYSLVKYADKVLDNTTSINVTLSFPEVIADESLVCVYRVPFLLSEEGAAMRYETMANDGVDIIAKVLTSTNTLVLGFGNSVLANKSVFTNA